MRPKSACAVCRARRRKCIRTRHGTACDYCAIRHLPCTVPAETEFQQHHISYKPVLLQERQESTVLPAIDLCEELIELYFRYIHICFHTVFHQPTFLNAFRSGSLPRVLLFAVMGMSARFSRHETLAHVAPRHRGRLFTREAERLLNLHDVSLTTIQACLLLGASAVVEGEGATESIYFSIASRVALLMDLPNAPADTRIQQELNYRVWWAVYETDTWSSTGVRLPKMVPLRRDVPLPMSERQFLDLSPSTLPEEKKLLVMPSDGGAKDSLIAYSVTVNIMLSQVDGLNSSAVSGSLHGAQLTQAVDQVLHELDGWARSLPHNMADTDENLAYWTEQGFGKHFVVLHMNYHYICQLLLYQFLHGGSSFTSRYAMRCRHSATRVCELIHKASQYRDAELLNTIVGHVIALASTVQLHILLFSGDETEKNRARRLLLRNFDILTRLKEYWPCLDISIARFELFHKACERSLDDSLFRLDKWMLKFMLEFAAPPADGADRLDMADMQLPWALVSE